MLARLHAARVSGISKLASSVIPTLPTVVTSPLSKPSSALRFSTTPRTSVSPASLFIRRSPQRIVPHVSQAFSTDAPASSSGPVSAPAGAPFALSGTGKIPEKPTYTKQEVKYVIFLLSAGVIGTANLPPTLRPKDGVLTNPNPVSGDKFLTLLNNYTLSLPEADRHEVFQREYNRYHYLQAELRFGGDNSLVNQEIVRMQRESGAPEGPIKMGMFQTNFATGEVNFSVPEELPEAAKSTSAKPRSRIMTHDAGIVPVPPKFSDSFVMDDTNADKILSKRENIFRELDVTPEEPAENPDGTPARRRRSAFSAAQLPRGVHMDEDGSTYALGDTADPNIKVKVPTSTPLAARRAIKSTAAAAEAKNKDSLASKLSRADNGLMSSLKAHLMLSKPRISAMVALTSWWGYWLTVPTGASDPFTLGALTLGTLSLAAAASVINQIREIDVDGRMARTAGRPLVTGKISPRAAKIATALYTLIGSAVLWVVDPVVAGLGLANVVLYGGVYTSLKRVTRFNTEVGALVGAIPPIMGYAAALPPGADFFTYDPVALLWPAALMVAWQMQHVMLICLRRADDYNRSGLKMECFDDPGLMRTRAKGLAWAAVTALVAAAPQYLGWSDIRHLAIVYLWVVYTGLYASGALPKIPKQKILLMALYLGYLILGATLVISVIAKDHSSEEKYKSLLLNL